MKGRTRFVWGVLLAGCAFIGYLFLSDQVEQGDRDIRLPPEQDPEFVSDTLREKQPRFDPDLVDSRPLGGWEINASAAVVGLDSPRTNEVSDKKLLELQPSYAAAAKAAAALGKELLPSANMIDGKAKQFDDGLYAALDLAAFRGELGITPAVPAFVVTVFGRLPPGSPARPFLAAALELAGEKVPLDGVEAERKKEFLDRFGRNEFRSKPISFYTWTKDLGRVWRFFRFLQEEFVEDSRAIPRALADALRADPVLLVQYRAVNAFYGRLTNPLISLPVDLLEDGKSLRELAAMHGARRPKVAFFPPSTSRETELFDTVFEGGIPAEANLMSELVRRIRSGEVDLAPGARGGWYQHQVYALETLLLPTRGQEKDKLLLSADYKRRLLAAFKALLTKRRETHARQLGMTEAAMAPPAPRPVERVELKPRLRIEPLATYYLRTARAYAFLEGFLEAAAGRPRIAALRGLREGGTREQSLAEELATMKRLFYGLYFVACEDIGLRPQLAPEESVSEATAKAEALAWIDSCLKDPDLAQDTRVSVPIARDALRNVTRIWATLGVRLAKLDAGYEFPPLVRRQGVKDWQEPYGESWKIVTSHYLIPVDEFAELELKGAAALTRKELRKICDKGKTREKIIEKLLR